MKYTVLFLLIVGMLLVALPSHALSVAIVDMQRVMADAKAAKSAKDQLESKQKQFQNQVRKTETDLQKQDQELAKQRSLLSADAFKEKLEEFRDEAASAQKDVQTKRIKLRRAFELSIVTIQKKVTQIIADIAKSKGYDAVLPKAQTLYTNDGLDITNEVLSRLDRELPALTVNFGK